LLQDTCPGLVQQIEKGELDSNATRKILERSLRPMLEKNIDTVVLGCTHYPFVIPLIQQITGPEVRVIDPAPAVARQVGRLLDAAGLRQASSQPGEVRIFTSGDIGSLQLLLPRLLGESGSVEKATWTVKGKNLTLNT
jgi:glutamate racemase